MMDEGQSDEKLPHNKLLDNIFRSVSTICGTVLLMFIAFNYWRFH